MEYTSPRTDLSTRLLKGEVCHAMRLPSVACLTCSQFLLYRHAVHTERRPYQCAERYRSGSTGRGGLSPVEAKNDGGLRAMFQEVVASKG